MATVYVTTSSQFPLAAAPPGPCVSSRHRRLLAWAQTATTQYFFTDFKKHHRSISAAYKEGASLYISWRGTARAVSTGGGWAYSTPWVPQHCPTGLILCTSLTQSDTVLQCTLGSAGCCCCGVPAYHRAPSSLPTVHISTSLTCGPTCTSFLWKYSKIRKFHNVKEIFISISDLMCSLIRWYQLFCVLLKLNGTVRVQLDRFPTWEVKFMSVGEPD